MIAISGLLVWFLVLPCSAFVRGRPLGAEGSRIVQPTFRSITAPPSSLRVRGGSDSSLRAASDFSGAARVLFQNMVSPSALLAGGLVPLGFIAPPIQGDKQVHKNLRKIYYVLSVLSLANELTAIVYATVAANKLTETVIAPASSTFELIQRDFQLEWVATNVHFLLGLFGFLGLIGLRAYTIFPVNLKHPCAGFVVSTLLLMCSIVNRGVQEGDRSGSKLGLSFGSLITRYFVLLAKRLYNTGGIVLGASMLLGTVSSILAVRALLTAEGD